MHLLMSCKEFKNYTISVISVSGYHWDTSDWAPEKSLPNISELPGGECPDSPGSSSPHSNESNTHINNVGYQGEDRTNYSANIPEGDYIDSEYVGDSECTDNEYDAENAPELPNYEQILAEQSKLLEDYELPSHNINIHPDYYLPLNSSFTSDKIPLETLENWAAPPGYDISSGSSASSDDDNDSVLHYGFPPTHTNINRLSMITTDSEANGENRLSAAYTSDSEFNGEYNRVSAIDDISVGENRSRNASMSDISGLCEIEDSEDNILDSEDENTPLTTQRIHTEV